jgi:hypothetical protein
MKKSVFRRRWWVWGVAAMIAVIGFSVLYCRLSHPAEEYRRFNSPDGRYAVIVYRIPSCFPMMPGQGGDAKGFVRLVDHEGKILREKPVEMVNTIDMVEWDRESVFIGLFPEWPLSPSP